jgi:hypothetical protein
MLRVFEIIGGAEKQGDNDDEKPIEMFAGHICPLNKGAVDASRLGDFIVSIALINLPHRLRRFPLLLRGEFKS